MRNEIEILVDWRLKHSSWHLISCLVIPALKSHPWQWGAGGYLSLAWGLQSAEDFLLEILHLLLLVLNLLHDFLDASHDLGRVSTSTWKLLLDRLFELGLRGLELAQFIYKLFLLLLELISDLQWVNLLHHTLLLLCKLSDRTVRVACGLITISWLVSRGLIS